MEAKTQFPRMIWDQKLPNPRNDPCRAVLHINQQFKKDQYELKVTDDHITFNGKDINDVNYSFDWNWSSPVKSNTVNIIYSEAVIIVEVELQELGEYNFDKCVWPDGMGWSHPYSKIEEEKFKGYEEQGLIKRFSLL